MITFGTGYSTLIVFCCIYPYNQTCVIFLNCVCIYVLNLCFLVMCDCLNELNIVGVNGDSLNGTEGIEIIGAVGLFKKGWLFCHFIWNIWGQLLIGFTGLVLK